MNNGLFNSRDDLSDLLHELREEFDSFGNASFAIRKIGEYDEIVYPIVANKLEGFNKWIKSNTDYCAEISLKRTHRRVPPPSQSSYDDGYRDDDDSSSIMWIWEVYMVWTGRRI